MKYSSLDYQDLLFHADYASLSIKNVDEEILLKRSWDHVEAKLSLPQYQQFK